MSDGPRHLVVGTAGHIDHGKSTLVAALTGTDPDRLPEEQERGITIDLGFAHAEGDEDTVLSFVDVPGHERFVKNMLAGAGGVDLVLLVVAADESVMPQTREHFQICRLLGARHGVVALTKADLVEEDLVALVRLEVEEMVAGSFLEGCPILACSGVTGEGVEAVREALVETGRRAEVRGEEGPFRQPVDRVFSVKGFGTVVTGTSISGTVAEGDTLEVLPSGEGVKVRGIQVHGGKVPEAVAGQRVALNLQGVSRDEIERGDWLVIPGRYRPVSMVDAVVELIPNAPAPLEDMDRVRFHIGAREALARVRVLEPDGTLAPGERGFVQVRLEGPVHITAGERFVLRRYSPITTIAGGTTLDPLPPKRSRHEDRARRHLEELAGSDPDRMLTAWIRDAGRRGAPLADLRARVPWTEKRLSEEIDALVEKGGIVPAGEVFFAPEVWKELEGRALELLEDHHRRQPLAAGMGAAELREILHLPDEVFQAFLARAQEEGLLRREGDAVAATGHEVRLSEEEERTRAAIDEAFRSGGLTPPDEKEVLGSVEGSRVREIEQLLLDEGRLVRLKGGYVFHAEVLDRLIEEVRQGPEAFSVPEFKDRTGTTRKHAIPLLEYLDGKNVTVRTGDRRQVLPARAAAGQTGSTP